MQYMFDSNRGCSFPSGLGRVVPPNWPRHMKDPRLNRERRMAMMRQVNRHAKQHTKSDRIPASVFGVSRLL